MRGVSYHRMRMRTKKWKGKRRFQGSEKKKAGKTKELFPHANDELPPYFMGKTPDTHS
jgi:hypothetical protein